MTSEKSVNFGYPVCISYQNSVFKAIVEMLSDDNDILAIRTSGEIVSSFLIYATREKEPGSDDNAK